MRTFLHDTHLKECELDICVEYSQTPYDPGVTSGPAESCYPPEGGDVEIVASWTEPDGKDVVLSDDECETIINEILELPIDHYDDGPDPDEMRDAKIDDRLTQ